MTPERLKQIKADIMAVQTANIVRPIKRNQIALDHCITLIDEVERLQALERREVDPDEMATAIKEGCRLVGLEGSPLWFAMGHLTKERARQWGAYTALHMGMNLKPSAGWGHLNYE